MKLLAWLIVLPALGAAAPSPDASGALEEALAAARLAVQEGRKGPDEFPSVPTTPKKVSFSFSPEGSVQFVRLLARGAGLPVGPEGLRPGDEIRSSACEVEALRPPWGSDPAAAPGNRVSCAFEREDGSGGRVGLDLARAPLQAFGNRFQHFRSLLIKGAAAEALWGAMKGMSEAEPDNPLLKREEMVFPSTGDAMLGFAIKRRPASGQGDAPPADMECTKFLQWGKPWAVFCSFLDVADTDWVNNNLWKQGRFQEVYPER